jgi:hypothetical protein
MALPNVSARQAENPLLHPYMFAAMMFMFAGVIYEYFDIGNDRPVIWKNGKKQVLEIREPKAR